MATIKPYYGTQYSFKALGTSFESNDGYVYGGNIGANNLSISVSVSIPNQTDAETSGALNTLSNLSGTGLFELEDGNGVYNHIYLNIDSYTNNYKFKDINDINVVFSANHLAKSLKWSGAYLDSSFVSGWSSGVAYNRYDVVHYKTDLNTSNGGVVSGNYLDRFFYCTADVSGGSNPLVNTGFWTNYNLPIDIEIDLSTEFRSKVEVAIAKGSFDQRIPYGQVNPNRMLPLSIEWKNLTTKQLRCLTHFFENKQGYKRFNIPPPSSPWGPFYVFVCQEWQHTTTFYDSHSVRATFLPDLRFKNVLFTGFNYGYTDLNPLMTAQWVGYSGV